MMWYGASTPRSAAQLARRFEVLLPHLNERQQRLALATEARLLGHGGVRAVAEASRGQRDNGAHRAWPSWRPVRTRCRSGGRAGPEVDASGPTTKTLSWCAALLRLVEPDERGDPMSPLRWTTKSLRHLAEELARQGHPVSAPTVGRLLRENGFSLQGTAKTLEGAQHPDRDAQFRYINEQVKAHQAAGEPVISVDAKKKEQLGQLPAAGREWRPKGEPVRVEDHSFFTAGPDVARGRPLRRLRPDRRRRLGERRRRPRHLRVRGRLDPALVAGPWGPATTPARDRLLITADAGGSNSYRYRLWKAELAAFAAETGLAITVCHFPPGTRSGTRSSTGCSPRSP